MPSSHEIVWLGDIALIYCRGRIVAGETDALRDVLLRAIQSTGKVVLHLASVTHMDSTGLGLLAYLCAAARRRSGDLKLVAPSSQLKKILAVTMVGQIFDIYPTEEAASSAFLTAK